MAPDVNSVLADIRLTGTAVANRVQTYFETREDLACRMGRDLRDMAVEPVELPTWNLAERQSRVARVAGVVAAAVFAAGGLLAVPFIALLPVLHEQVLSALAPLSHSPNELLAGLASQAAALPLAGTVLWALIYTGWLRGVYMLVSSAHCGRSRWLVRMSMGVLSLAFGLAGFQLLSLLNVPFLAALAPLTLILAAWRLLAWSTRQHALTADRLNWISAHREIAREKRAARSQATQQTAAPAADLQPLSASQS